MQWQPLSDQRYRLAEGPFWDVPQQALYWVDIPNRRALRLIDGVHQAWRLPEPVSAFIPTDRGDALVTLASGVYRLDLSSPSEQPELTLLCAADPVPGNRANEARVDPQGRLWLGTMQNNFDEADGDLPVTRSSGGLFLIQADGQHRCLLRDQGIVNTLVWPIHEDAVLSADSLAGELYRYPLLADGSLGARSIWAEAGPGSPDGSAMDAQGYVWNARWEGHCLIRFAPDGCIDRIVDLPVSHPTSCVFGGPGLSRLYVTSARASERPGELDGAVLHAEVGIVGMPCRRFAG